ncbi:60S ribosomal protein L35a-3 [Capsicum baccatum]|uniref:60S ribosomal protein L35a-3 n=1 Tax=Capsicum baccatum TaxID=33114 RepID=A0A2G2X592_CAPBA|nr:60S ribosomal protein L35a-3 [Capsicum baccatum]
MVKGRQGERVRLYVRGTVLGYKRSKSNQYPNTSLIQIEGVNTKEEVDWYLGKRLGYIYKAKTKKNNSHYRCIWGKVCRPHGNSGVVRAKFKSNLPPKSMNECAQDKNDEKGYSSINEICFNLYWAFRGDGSGLQSLVALGGYCLPHRCFQRCGILNVVES